MGGRNSDASEPSEGPPRLLHNEIAIMQKLCKIMQKVMQKVVPLPSSSPWLAPSLRLAFVGVEKPGGGGAASISSDSGQDIGNRLTSKLKLELNNETICVSVK